MSTYLSLYHIGPNRARKCRSKCSPYQYQCSHVVTDQALRCRILEPSLHCCDVPSNATVCRAKPDVVAIDHNRPDEITLYAICSGMAFGEDLVDCTVFAHLRFLCTHPNSIGTQSDAADMISTNPSSFV